MKIMLPSIVKRLFIASLFFFIPLSNALEGNGFNIQFHKDWMSALVKNQNQIVPKIVTRIDGGADPVFTMEFTNESIFTGIIFSKTGGEIGNIKHKNPIKTPCFFRVDTKEVNEFECLVVDDDNSYVIGLISDKLDQNLLKKFHSGSKLRIKVAPYDDQPEPLYLRFSLSGFSAAYKRALELLNEDAKFFE